jgi:glyoxylase-like metal-dependent hydrolase (beta-lactamase superfamily II)
MPGTTSSATAPLRYAVSTARRAGLTRDLPYGPQDLQWVANTATLVYGERHAVLVDTYAPVDQNAELVDWVRSFGRDLTHIYITHGHGDHLFGIGQLLAAFPRAKPVAAKGTVAAYLRDFNRLAATARTAEELYGGMLELYPRRANPGSLWGGAKAAMSSAA